MNDELDDMIEDGDPDVQTDFLGNTYYKGVLNKTCRISPSELIRWLNE